MYNIVSTPTVDWMVRETRHTLFEICPVINKIVSKEISLACFTFHTRYYGFHIQDLHDGWIAPMYDIKSPYNNAWTGGISYRSTAFSSQTMGPIILLTLEHTNYQIS